MSLFERTLEFSGFPFKRAEQDYLQIQSLDPKAFDYWQLCQRLRMVKHHLDHSPFYQDLIGSAQKDELVRRISENPQAKAVLAKGINSGTSLEASSTINNSQFLWLWFRTLSMARPI
jgi:hypothetical protein